MHKLFCIALLGGTSAFAQTTSNPCDVPVGTPLPPGCIPLTYKPADGGPERPVFLGFTPGPEPVQMGPVKSRRGGGAQAAAEKPLEFDLGVDASYAKQDYRADANILTGVFLTVTGRHFGGEVNAHYTAVSRGGIRENTLLAGPRYSVINNRKLVVYAKASFGVGHFGGNPADPAGANGQNYFVQSYGGGVDFHISKHMNIRAFDGEYERWSSFPPSGLSPYNLGAGVSFRL